MLGLVSMGLGFAACGAHATPIFVGVTVFILGVVYARA
jgi:hypothetical protein